MPTLNKEQRLTSELRLDADVLVIGGGPAGAWAALAAAREGRSVVLVDKGYLGTSGATAPSNTGTWCVPPGEGRQQSVERQWQKTADLGDQRWMLRCVDTAYERLLDLAENGYPFPTDEGGTLYIANLRGPDYMHFMRRRVLKAGVTVLDHHPALELLAQDGALAGARGYDRQRGRDWQVDADAVVLATGGCAFFERILGGTGLTGDGYLMAAEAGARLSGMEFTGKYTIAPHGSSLNKGLPYRWGTFLHADGTPLCDAEGAPITGGLRGSRQEADLARALIAEPIYVRLDRAEPALQEWLRQGQPNCFVPHDRNGIDPFSQPFRITLRAEGTIRGTGGIAIATEDCGTGVPGLYAAGDAASREALAGANSGGGSVNASWAIASGWWAGTGAARHVKRRGSTARNKSTPLGTIGLRPAAAVKAGLDPSAIVTAVREEALPLDRNYFRTATTLEQSRDRLESLWNLARDHLYGEDRGALRAREAAAALASARWSVAAALARTESRGMHRRLDYPETDPALLGSLRVGGLERVRVDAPRGQIAERAS